MLLGKWWNKIKSSQGFSLLETTIALAILTIGVIYLVTVFPFGLNAARTSEQSTIAVNLAQAKIEEVISTLYSEVAVSQSVEPSLSALDSDFAGFSRITTVSLVDEDLGPVTQDVGLKKVMVEVLWQDALKHATSSVSLITLIADY